jgi:hypothetical protein
MFPGLFVCNSDYLTSPLAIRQAGNFFKFPVFLCTYVPKIGGFPKFGNKEDLKTNTIILLGVLGAIGYFLYSRARAVGGLIFLPRGLSAGSGSIQIMMGVQNPSDVPVPISSFAGNLVVNGSAIGAVSDFVPTVIAPNSETQITLNVAPNIFGVVNGAINMIKNGTQQFKAVLQGTVNVGGALFSINQNLS